VITEKMTNNDGNLKLHVIDTKAKTIKKIYT